VLKNTNNRLRYNNIYVKINYLLKTSINKCEMDTYFNSRLVVVLFAWKKKNTREISQETGDKLTVTNCASLQLNSTIMFSRLSLGFCLEKVGYQINY
jgi:hypothetical protein